MKLAPKNFDDVEIVKECLITSYNLHYTIEIEGKAVGVADYWPNIRENIERFSQFLFETDKGEGTIISCSELYDGVREIVMLTEIREITALTPNSTIYFGGKAEFDPTLEKISASYNPYPPTVPRYSWCVLEYIIPPADSTFILTSSKKLDEISEKELEGFERQLEIKDELLKKLQETYIKKKERVNFEINKLYV